MRTQSWTRKPAVAGRFYPSDPGEIRKMLGEYLSAPEKKANRPMIVVPHAGYIYSGEIAGEAYRRTEIPETVIVLCPNHTGMGEVISVWSRGEWETPLGKVPVDEKLSASILELTGQKEPDIRAHLEEHAIEVHVPFLQVLQPKLKIVPICLGPLPLERCVELGEAIAKAIQSYGSKVLVVASTDMSHYISAAEAKKQDAPALAAIEKLSPSELYTQVITNDISMCGFIPTTVALEVARRLGATHAEVVRYGNSGEQTGSDKSVVAYASAVT